MKQVALTDVKTYLKVQASLTEDPTALAIALGNIMANTFKVVTKAGVTSEDVIYTGKFYNNG